VTVEESAQDVARRIRADAERRRRATGPGAGRSAGSRTAAALASLPPSWSTLPQRRRRGSSEQPDPSDAPVRHLTVGPGGVFAITSPAGGEDADPVGTVRQAQAWADAVRLSAGPFAAHVVAIACLPLTASPPAWTALGDVVVCHSGTLPGVLTGAPAVLSPAEVAAAAIRLEAARQTGTAHPDRPTRPLPWPPGAWGVAARVLVGLLLVLVLVVLALVGTRISGGLGGAP
jgi:hypothetical protein